MTREWWKTARARECRDGPLKELTRLFTAVWLDTGNIEDALWATLEADRRERADEWPAVSALGSRAPSGQPRAPRSAVVAVLKAAAAETGVPAVGLRGPGRNRSLTKARHLAIRVLRKRGYSYRAIGRAVCRRENAVMKALRRVAASHDLVEAAARVERRARRLAA